MKKNVFVRTLGWILENILLFIVAQIIVFAIISIPLIYYGPFTTIRDKLVERAMTTMNHKYIATYFLKEDVIKEIINKNKFDDNKNSNEEAISVMAISNQSNDSVKEKKNIEDIRITNIEIRGQEGFVVEIKDPTRVKVGVAKTIPDVGMQVDEIAKENEAIVAINAGGFSDPNGVGNGGIPIGLVMKNGKIAYDDKNRPISSIIGLNKSGILVLGKYTKDQAVKKGVEDAVSFFPFLIVDGQPMIKEGDGGWGFAARTGIGQKKDGTIVFVVINGKNNTGLGASLKDLQSVMLQYNVYNGANLDGGASTVLYYKGKILNKPASSTGYFRPVPTVFMVK